MDYKKMQEEWLKNNEVKKTVYDDGYITADGHKRSSKSYLENHESKVVIAKGQDKADAIKKLDDGAVSTLSKYSIEEKDEIIGKKIRTKETNLYLPSSWVTVVRKIKKGYVCDDGIIRTKYAILKQEIKDNS